MTRRPMLWDMPEWAHGGDRFPVGTYVRVDRGNTPTERAHTNAGQVGRVTGTNGGRMVAVRFDARTGGNFDADWLLPVRYVSVRFHGPAIARDGSSLGSRYVATGLRGDRMRLTWKADHALRPVENAERAALAYARDRLGMCDPSAEHWQDRRTGAHVYALTDYGTCECSPDDYGPCEFHGETLVVREGASTRTADELSHEFLEDVCSVTRSYPSPEFERDMIRIGNALADNRSDYGTAWLPDPDEDGEDMRDTLADMVDTAESHLAAHGLSAYWEDGYRIVRVTGGPLA